MQPMGQQSVLVGPQRRNWGRVLGLGSLLYLVGLAVLILTSNPNLFPTVGMLGTFLVPVTYVAFFYDHRHLSQLTIPTIALSFFYGGVLGVFAAAMLEPLVIHRLTAFSAVEVGLIEECAKILGVLVIARRRQHGSELDGLILGAAAGMGFAALESNGYAFTVFLSSGGNLTATVLVTLLRGVLAPIGHGTWTAILSGVLFRESGGQKFRMTAAVLRAYLTVALLHGLWDGLPSLFSALTVPGADLIAAEALVGFMGLLLLWRRWREAITSAISGNLP